jgi:quercetin dioxygenase-like cupin family protein
MDRAEFIRMLKQEGYQEFATVERGSHAELGLHSHPFEARALILLGELRLVVDEQEQVCRTGDQFHLAAHILHSETCGAEGVHYLVGRKPG